MNYLTKGERDEYWILLIVNFYSNQKIGATPEEIYRKDKRRVNLSLHQILLNLKKLKLEKLVEEKLEKAQSVYTITKKGKKVLNKNLKKLTNSDFMDLISLAPPEIILNYRVYNIENTLVYGIFGALLFQISLWLIRINQIIPSLIALLLSIFFIGYSIGHFSNIITLVLFRIFKSVGEKIPRWIKIRKIFIKISNRKIVRWFVIIIKKVLRKLHIIIALILLLGALIFVNYIYYKTNPQGFRDNWLWEVIVLIIAGICFLLKKLVSKPTKSDRNIEQIISLKLYD
ncbi:hypothetical protein GOV14_07120 [Candidatus Pacearchaeota archaeon]|nr:hypothetical protein [Candidatus Pacearchaeota archaeon]